MATSAQFAILTLAASVCTAPLPTMAQPSDASARDRARTLLVVRVADALKLSDEDALKVSRVIRHFDERRQGLVQQRQALEQTLRRALAQSPIDTMQLGGLVKQGNDLDQHIALIPEETFRELQGILSIEQQAQLLLLRQELQAEGRRALQRPVPGTRRSGARENTPSK